MVLIRLAGIKGEGGRIPHGAQLGGSGDGAAFFIAISP
jgi:hypothetical protein